jgi:hypothetical protein
MKKQKNVIAHPHRTVPVDANQGPASYATTQEETVYFHEELHTMRRSLAAVSVLAWAFICSESAWAQNSLEKNRKHYFPPERVSVLPVVFTPKGEKAPRKELDGIVLRHLKWTQRRYGELLGTTFEIEDKIRRVRGKKTLDEYRERDGNAVLDFAAELLQEFGYNRFNCPHVFLIVVANSKDDWPIGVGSVLNGGYNTGGGATMMSTDVFTKKPNTQSTLEHELGHTFGLPHVDVYGIEMTGNNPSLMSYNQAHWTRGFEPSLQPAAMIPEDIRALALNDRLIPNLEFSSTKDVPDGYKLFWTPIPLAPIKMEGQPDYTIEVKSNAGSAFNSKVESCVVGYFRQSPGPDISFDAGSMWHSEPVAENVTLDLTFPFPVELTKIRLYSGHSGQYHPVKAFSCSVPNADGTQKLLANHEMKSFDGEVTFAATESQHWHLELTPSESKTIVLRGLRFYSGTTEVFPPQLCLVE